MDHMRFNASYKAMQVCVLGSKPAAACSHLSTAALRCQHAAVLPVGGLGWHAAAAACASLSCPASLEQPQDTLSSPSTYSHLHMRSCAVCRRSALCPCSAMCCAVQFDPELLADQRRRGWGDRQLNSLGIETRPDGSLIVSVAVERVDGKILRSACWQPLHAEAATCRSKGRRVAADSQPKTPSSFPPKVDTLTDMPAFHATLMWAWLLSPVLLRTLQVPHPWHGWP